MAGFDAACLLDELNRAWLQSLHVSARNGVGMVCVEAVDIGIEAGDQLFIGDAVGRRVQSGCGNDRSELAGHSGSPYDEFFRALDRRLRARNAGIYACNPSLFAQKAPFPLAQTRCRPPHWGNVASVRTC